MPRLPQSNVCVNVGPPLFCRPLKSGATSKMLPPLSLISAESRILYEAKVKRERGVIAADVVVGVGCVAGNNGVGNRDVSGSENAATIFGRRIVDDCAVADDRRNRIAAALAAVIRRIKVYATTIVLSDVAGNGAVGKREIRIAQPQFHHHRLRRNFR